MTADGARPLGEVLRELRLQAELTQHELAALTASERGRPPEVSVRTIQEIEAGRQEPRRDTLTRLAQALEQAPQRSSFPGDRASFLQEVARLRATEPRRSALPRPRGKASPPPPRSEPSPVGVTPPAAEEGQAPQPPQRRWLNLRNSLLMAVVLGGLASWGTVTFLVGNSSQPPARTPAQIPTALTASCFEGAKSLSVAIPSGGLASTEEFATSPRCRDINVRFTSLPEDTEVRAVQCKRQGNWHSNWHTFHPGDTGWVEVATNMLDDTCFHLEMRSAFENTYQVAGDVAY